MKIPAKLTSLPSGSGKQTATIETDSGVIVEFPASLLAGERADFFVGCDVTVEAEIDYGKTESGIVVKTVAAGLEAVESAPPASDKYVRLEHPATGLSVDVKMGFSWTTFLFGFFFGIPLWLRKLHAQAGIMTAIMVFYYMILFNGQYVRFFGEEAVILFGIVMSVDEFVVTMIAFFIIIEAITIYFSFQANRLYARNLVSEGYHLQAGTTPEKAQKFRDYAGISGAGARVQGTATPEPAEPDLTDPDPAYFFQTEERRPSEQLQELKAIFEGGLITPGEYEAKRQDILARL